MVTLSLRNRDVQSNLWRRARISKKATKEQSAVITDLTRRGMLVDAEVQVGIKNVDRSRATSSSWSWSPDWNVSMVDIHLRKLLWVYYYPGHAGVKGNDRADRLAGKATLSSGSLLGGPEVLRSFRHYLRAQSQGLYIIDRLEARGVGRGSLSK